MKSNLISYIICLLLPIFSIAQISTEDSLALVNFYNTTNGPEWDIDSNWLDGPVSSWHGISVDNARVVEINLFRNNLSGPFPDTVTSLNKLEQLYLVENMLSGELPENMGELNELSGLYLESNLIEGEIPESIGDCENLEIIDLSYNLLTGTFPQSLSTLNELREIQVSNNQLTGNFPEALQDLKQLTSLDISRNNFNGIVPNWLDSLTSLTNLNISFNNFEGPFPKIHNLKELSDFNVSTQSLEGNLDSILGIHPKMNFLTASFNSFSGGISTYHFNADRLSRLSLSGNHLSELDDFYHFADTGSLFRLAVGRNALDFDDLEPNANLPIPDFNFDIQENVGDMETVYLNEGDTFIITSPMHSTSINYTWFLNGDTISNQTDDTLMVSDFDLTKSGTYYFVSTHPEFPFLEIMRNPVAVYPRKFVSKSDSLALVHLYNTTDGPNWTDNTNWLDGPVSTWYGIRVENERVVRIELYKNNLSGPFPDTIASLTALEYLDLGTNMLSGELPDDFGKLINLRFLRISSNELEGTIPESIGNCNSLQSIRMNNNNFTGTFPMTISNLINLTYIVAYKNNLSGPFPEVLLNMKQLETLDISTNNFTGRIPVKIDSLVNLTNLDLHYNNFSGPMPKIHNLINLKNLHLSGLDVEGNLDTILGYHPNMIYLTANLCQLTGRISTKHYDADNLNYLHLVGNQFTEMDDFSLFADTGGLIRLYVNDNALDFDDLAPNAHLAIGNFQYQNQKALGTSDTIHLDHGEEYTISSPMQNAMIDYIWLKDNDTIPTATEPSYTITDFDSSKVGVYTFASTHSDFPGLVIERNPVTIADANPSAVITIAESDWSMSPNPAGDQCKVHWKNGSQKKTRLFIFNTEGRRVLSTSFSQSHVIQCGDWAPGIYSVLIVVDGKTGLKRFIKQ